MKNKLTIFIFLISNLFSTLIFGLQIENEREQIEKIDSAYQLYRNGAITEPSDIFFNASKLIEKLPAPTEELKAKAVLLEAFGYHIASSYEYAMILSRMERRKLFINQTKLLEKIELDNFSNEMKASVQNITGMFLNRRGLYKKSSELFLEAIKNDPEWAFAYHNYGNVLYANGNYEDAEKYYKTAIEINSKLLRSYYNLAWSYYKTNRTNQAFELGKKALSIDPNYYHIYNLYAVIYSDLGDIESANKEYHKIIDINPNWITAYNNLAYECNESGQYYEAIDWAKKAIAIDPYSSMPYLRLGYSYKSLNKRDSAIYYFEKCNAIDSSCYSDIGWLHYNSREYKKAFTNALIEIEKDSTNSGALNLAGWSKYDLKDYESASQYFEKAVAIDSRSTSSLRGLAFSYSKLKSYEKAGETWVKLIKIDPSNKSHVYDSGYDFISIAKRAMEDDRKEDALKWLLTGSELGNKFCRSFAFGLMNEFGMDVPADYDLAMESYKNGARRLQFIWFLQKRIVSLYEENKVPMDSVDYNYWKYKVGDEGLKKFTIPCETKGGSKIKYNVFIVPHYPENVHPLEWEAERLMEEEGAKIPDEVIESFLKLMVLSIKNGVSFSELCVYALEAADIEKTNTRAVELKALIKNDTLSKDAHKLAHIELVELYTNQYQNDSTNTNLELLTNTTDDYIEFLASNNEVKLAEEIALNQIQSDPTKNAHYRTLARVHVKKLELKEYENSEINFSEIFTSNHLAALGVYYRYFVEKKDKANALLMQSRVLEINNSAGIKYILFKSQIEHDVDLFKELYLSDGDSLLNKSISNLVLEINKKEKDEDKLILYPYLLKLDDHLLTLTNDRESATKAIHHRAEYYLLKNELDQAEKILLERMKVDSIDNQIIRILARVHLKRLENAQKIDTTVDFDKYLVSNELAALAVYYRYFLDNKKKDIALVFQDRILVDNGLPGVKFILFGNQNDRGIDLFEELYLINNNNLKDDISYFEGEIRKTNENKEKLILYDYLHKMDEQLLETQNDSTTRILVAQHYNSTAWYQLLTGRFAESEANIYKGLKLNPNNLYFYTNLPASLLLQGKFEEAREMYLEWKDKTFDEEAGYPTFKDAFLDDFNAFKKEDVIPDEYKSDVEIIINLLNN